MLFIRVILGNLLVDFTVDLLSLHFNPIHISVPSLRSVEESV